MQTHHLNGYDYIYKPGSADTVNTLLLLHGTGGTEHDLLDFAEQIDPDANVISLKGNVIENGYLRFFERFSEGVFNEDDILKRSADIAEFVRLAKEKHGLENSAIVTVGFSNGANIASSVLLLHPGVLQGAILMRAMITIGPEKISQKVPEQADHFSADKDGMQMSPKILLLSGTNDQLIPAENAKKLAELLTERIASETREEARKIATKSGGLKQVWLEAGHGLTCEDLEHAKTWMNENFVK